MKQRYAKTVRVLLCACMTAVLLAGCGPKTPADSPSASSAQQTDISPAGPAESTGPAESVQPEAPEEESQSAVLYIGTKESGFAEYPMEYEGALTPELLIQGIAGLTGWDLTLADAVTTGKGGMSVCFAGTSALYVGPPDPQKNEFHMYDGDQLAQTILDSIQKTLQMGFTGVLGDPDALDIYFLAEGDQPLELPDIGRSWPIDQPYQWSEAQFS